MEFVKNPKWIPDQVRKNPVRNKNKSPVTKISVDIPDTTAEGTGINFAYFETVMDLDLDTKRGER